MQFSRKWVGKKRDVIFRKLRKRKYHFLYEQTKAMFVKYIFFLNLDLEMKIQNNEMQAWGKI